MLTRTLVHGQAAPGAPERLIKGVVFAVLSLAVIIPFLTVFSTSVAPREQISDAGGLVLFPRSLDLTAYEAIFSGGVVARALAVSVFVTVVGTALSLFVSCLLAYAISRKHFVLGRPVLLVVLIGMLSRRASSPSIWSSSRRACWTACGR